MSHFLPLNEAATHFGFSSRAALRRSFERGGLPGQFLLRIGARGLRVDVAGLEKWLRDQQAYGGVSTRGGER